eukprot:12759535-Prorocentrum_lima.AAC.1
MTSSLVGSEMCIRDRSSSLDATIQDKNGQQDLYHFQDQMTQKSKKGTQAVSYTHLTLPTICSV